MVENRLTKPIWQEVKREMEERQKVAPMDWETVKLRTAGTTVEEIWVERLNRLCRIQRLDRDHYMLLSGPMSGLVCEYKHTENRADNIASITHSIAQVRDLINANVYMGVYPNCKWVTLTYKRNMRDAERVMRDYGALVKRVRRKYPGMEYIAVLEPQERGSWHLHVFWIWGFPAPYIPQSELLAWWREITGGGGVYVHAINDGGDNMGAYLSGYLGNAEYKEGMALQDGQEVLETKSGKRYVKGARWHYYPPGTRIYRCSRGVSRPVEEYMSHESAKKIVGAATLTKSRVFEIINASGYKTHIRHDYYNTVRNKK